MAGDVFVTFGADTAGLEAGAAVARAQVNALAAEVRRLGNEMSKTGATVDSELGQKLLGAADRFSDAKRHAAELAATLRETGGAELGAGEMAKKAAEGISRWGITVSEATREGRALVDELSSGRYRQALGSFSKLFGDFAAANPGIAAAAVAFLAAAGALGYFAYEGYEADKALKQIRSSLTLGTASGLDDTQIRAFVTALKALPGSSATTASKVVDAFGMIRSASASLVSGLVANIGEYAQVSGQDLPEAAKEWVTLFNEPLDAAKKLEAMFPAITAEEMALYAAAQQTGSVYRAQAALLQIISNRMAVYRAQSLSLAQKQRLADIDAAAGDAGTSDNARRIAEQNALRAVTESIAAAQEKVARATRDATEALQGEIAVPIEQLKAALDTLGETPAGNVQKISAEIARLRGGLNATTDDAAKLIRVFETFKSGAYKDTDGRYRVGYGSDTTTSASGQVSPVTASTTTTQADAERDLARRIGELTEQLRAKVGAGFDALSPQGRASLTSVAYNYGINGVPQSVLSAAQAGDNSGLAAAIGAQRGANGGINANRRNEEAQNITGPTVDQQLEINQAIEARNDALRKAEAAEVGGNATAQATLDIARRNATQAQDAVKDAQELVEAKKKDLSTTQGGSAEAQVKAQQELAQAQAALREKQVEAARSADTLMAAEAQRGSKQELDARQAALAAEQGLYAQGSARWNELQAQRVSLARQYSEQQLQIARQETEEEVSAAKDAAKQRETVLAEQLKTHQINQQQWLQQTRDALQDEAQDTADALARELALQGQTAVQRATILRQMAAADATYNQQVLQAAEKTSEQITAQWQSMGQQIEGAFNSQLRGLLAGTTSWQTAMQKIAQDLVVKFIEAAEKIVVNWIVGEAAKTTATITGNAARTASDTAAGATSAATGLAGLLPALSADAAKVFGGIFAFLAPALGPAAAAPAAAGSAAVMAAAAVPAAAVGGYVMSDGMALIHAGETIVPAQMSQPFSGGMLGGGGENGSTIHNWNISAIDAQSFASALSNQGSFLARMIAQQFNVNPSLRPSY